MGPYGQGMILSALLALIPVRELLPYCMSLALPHRSQGTVLPDRLPGASVGQKAKGVGEKEVPILVLERVFPKISEEKEAGSCAVGREKHCEQSCPDIHLLYGSQGMQAQSNRIASWGPTGFHASWFYSKTVPGGPQLTYCYLAQTVKNLPTMWV